MTYINPFITKKFIKECPYIGTKILNSFYYFKRNTIPDTLPNNPMIGYFKHNIKRKLNIPHNVFPKIDQLFTIDTFINVARTL